MRIISIDPGVMTGYCYAYIKDKKLYYCPFQMTDEVDDLWRRLIKFDPRFIIIEDFEYRSGQRGRGLNLFPVQLIGVARLFSEIGYSRQLFLQKASTGKSYYTDAVLKKKELYIRGIPHGMDSSRHLLQWITFGYGYQFINDSTDFAQLVQMEAFAK